MRAHIVGIDPGKSGGVALVHFTDNMLPYLASCADVPQHTIKGKSRADYVSLAAMWKPIIETADHVFIEQVGAMPGQGVTSMFSFGYSAGFAYGLVLAAGKPHTFITPQSWKKIQGLHGPDKDQARRRATQLFPAHSFARKKDAGIAEAALIAHAGGQRLRFADVAGE